MPYRKEKFETGQIYHVFLRGIDGKTLFKNIDDYYRGIFSIYEFNNIKSVLIKDRRKIRIRFKRKCIKTTGEPLLFVDSRDKLVEILAFCIMPNHLHLLLRQVKDGGIFKFMKKLGSGYGRYFNKKYNRKGYVFQNRLVAVHIENDDQVMIIFGYNHSHEVPLL